LELYVSLKRAIEPDDVDLNGVKDGHILDNRFAIVRNGYVRLYDYNGRRVPVYLRSDIWFPDKIILGGRFLGISTVGELLIYYIGDYSY
jgi:hypothetical protein